jgi:hypothetical protein
LLVESDGSMLAHFFLQKLLLFGDRTTGESITVDGDAALVRWKDYAGAGFETVEHVTRLRYDRGKFQIDDKIVAYDHDATAQLVINAAHDGDRSALLDRDAVTDNAWNRLVGILAGQPEQYVYGCTEVTAEQYDCELWMDVDSDWSVNVVRDRTTSYGWQVTSVTRR